jgi:phosphoribosylglycinamide formyltransferase 1
MAPADGHLLIVNIAVRPDQQGRGLGDKLLYQAERFASLGLEEIRLYANAMMTSNLDFYGRRGYQEFRRGTVVPGTVSVFMRKRDHAPGSRSGAIMISPAFGHAPASAEQPPGRPEQATARKRVAVLISGRGSNMAALIAAARNPAYPAEIAIVVSNRPEAGGLQRAGVEGIATAVVDHASFGKDRAAFEEAMQVHLDAHQVDLVCLAGFMRLLTPAFVSRWSGRLLNVHPALLPSFRGLHTHERALAAGVRIHGATVHYVVPEVDAGPIIAQAAVPVVDRDTPDTLAARVLAAELRLYPLALGLVAGGKSVLASEGVVRSNAAVVPTAQLIVPDPLQP